MRQPSKSNKNSMEFCGSYCYFCENCYQLNLFFFPHKPPIILKETQGTMAAGPEICNTSDFLQCYNCRQDVIGTIETLYMILLAIDDHFCVEFQLISICVRNPVHGCCN